MALAGVRLLAAAVVVVACVAAGCGADGPRTASERGRAVFQASCAQCHGGDLAGTGRGPSLLDEIYGPDQLSDAEFVDAIRNGVDQQRWEFGPMPGNGGFSDEQIDAVLTYVRSQQAAD